MSRSTLHSSWEEEIARSIERYPKPNSIGWELYRYFEDGGDEIGAAAAIVGKDPLFAIEAIRYSNTAAYGSRSAESVEDAVAILGLARLSRLALSYAFRSLSGSALPVYDLSSEEFYRQSLACAAAMERFFDDVPERRGTMYTVGLLHAVGEIFIDAAVRCLVYEPVRLICSSPTKLAAIEASFLGLNQANVAGMALRSWRFPASIYGPIERQFAARVGSRHFEAAQALGVARYVAGKVIEAGRGVASPMKDKDRIVYRGKPLSDVFEYALAQCEQLEAISAA